MNTITIPPGTQVKLQASISSDAIVGTTVIINDNPPKQSKLYKFNMDLGNISAPTNTKMSITSTFLIPSGTNINLVMNATQVAYSLLYNGQNYEVTVKKEKLTNSLFIVYADLTFM